MPQTIKEYAVRVLGESAPLVSDLAGMDKVVKKSLDNIVKGFDSAGKSIIKSAKEVDAALQKLITKEVKSFEKLSKTIRSTMKATLKEVSGDAKKEASVKLKTLADIETAYNTHAKKIGNLNRQISTSSDFKQQARQQIKALKDSQKEIQRLTETFKVDIVSFDPEETVKNLSDLRATLKTGVPQLREELNRGVRDMSSNQVEIIQQGQDQILRVLDQSHAKQTEELKAASQAQLKIIDATNKREIEQEKASQKRILNQQGLTAEQRRRLIQESERRISALRRKGQTEREKIIGASLNRQLKLQEQHRRRRAAVERTGAERRRVAPTEQAVGRIGAGGRIFSQVQQSATGLTSSLGPLGQALSKLGPIGTAVAIGLGAVVAIMASAVKAAAAFNDSVKPIEALMPRTAENTRKLGSSMSFLRKESIATGIPIAKLQTGLFNAASSVQAFKDDLNAGAEATVKAGKAAVAMGGQADSVVKAFTSIGNATKLNIALTENQDFIMNTLTNTFRQGTIPSVEEYLTSIAKSSKSVSALFEDSRQAIKAQADMTVALTNTGATASESATQIESFANQLLNTGKRTRLIAAGLRGIDAETGRITNLDELFESASNNVNKFSDILGQKNAIKALRTFADEGGKSFKVIADQSANMGNATDDMFEIMQESSKNASERVAAGWNDLMINIGASTDVMLTDLNNSIADVLASISDMFIPAEERLQNIMDQGQALAAVGATAKNIAKEISESLKSATDIEEGQAAQFFERIKNQMEGIKDISPVIAQNINEILNNPSLTTEERLKALKGEMFDIGEQAGFLAINLEEAADVAADKLAAAVGEVSSSFFTGDLAKGFQLGNLISDSEGLKDNFNEIKNELSGLKAGTEEWNDAQADYLDAQGELAENAKEITILQDAFKTFVDDSVKTQLLAAEASGIQLDKETLRASVLNQLPRMWKASAENMAVVNGELDKQLENLNSQVETTAALVQEDAQRESINAQIKSLSDELNESRKEGIALAPDFTQRIADLSELENLEGSITEKSLEQNELLEEYLAIQLDKVNSEMESLGIIDESNGAELDRLTLIEDQLKVRLDSINAEKLEAEIQAELVKLGKDENLVKSLTNKLIEQKLKGHEKDIERQISILEGLKAENETRLEALNDRLKNIKILFNAEKSALVNVLKLETIHQQAIVGVSKKQAELNVLKGKQAQPIEESVKDFAAEAAVIEAEIKDMQKSNQVIDKRINKLKALNRISKLPAFADLKPDQDKRGRPEARKQEKDFERERREAEKKRIKENEALAKEAQKAQQDAIKRRQEIEKKRLAKLKNRLAKENEIFSDELKLRQEKRNADAREIRERHAFTERLAQIKDGLQETAANLLQKSAGALQNLLRSIKPLTTIERIIEDVETAREETIDSFVQTVGESKDSLQKQIDLETTIRSSHLEKITTVTEELRKATGQLSLAERNLSGLKNLEVLDEGELSKLRFERGKLLEKQNKVDSSAIQKRSVALAEIDRLGDVTKKLSRALVKDVRANLLKLGIKLGEFGGKVGAAREAITEAAKTQIAKAFPAQKEGLSGSETRRLAELTNQIVQAQGLAGKGDVESQIAIQEKLQVRYEKATQTLQGELNALTGKADGLAKSIDENSQALETTTEAGATQVSAIEIETNLQELGIEIGGVIKELGGFQKLFEKAFDVSTAEESQRLFMLVRDTLRSVNQEFLEQGLTLDSFQKRLVEISGNIRDQYGDQIPESMRTSLSAVEDLIVLFETAEAATESLGSTASEDLAARLIDTKDQYSNAVSFIKKSLDGLEKDRLDKEKMSSAERIELEIATNQKVLEERLALTEELLRIEQATPAEERDIIEIAKLQTQISELNRNLEALPNVEDKLKIKDAEKQQEDLNKKQIEGADEYSKKIEGGIKKVTAGLKKVQSSIDFISDSIKDVDEIGDLIGAGEQGAAVQKAGDLTKKIGQALLNSSVPQMQVAGAIILGGGIIINMFGRLMDFLGGAEVSLVDLATERADQQGAILESLRFQRDEMQALIEAGNADLDTAEEKLVAIQAQNAALERQALIAGSGQKAAGLQVAGVDIGEFDPLEFQDFIKGLDLSVLSDADIRALQQKSNEVQGIVDGFITDIDESLESGVDERKKRKDILSQFGIDPGAFDTKDLSRDLRDQLEAAGIDIQAYLDLLEDLSAGREAEFDLIKTGGELFQFEIDNLQDAISLFQNLFDDALEQGENVEAQAENLINLLTKVQDRFRAEVTEGLKDLADAGEITIPEQLGELTEEQFQAFLAQLIATTGEIPENLRGLILAYQGASSDLVGFADNVDAQIRDSQASLARRLLEHEKTVLEFKKEMGQISGFEFAKDLNALLEERLEIENQILNEMDIEKDGLESILTQKETIMGIELEILRLKQDQNTEDDQALSNVIRKRQELVELLRAEAGGQPLTVEQRLKLSGVDQEVENLMKEQGFTPAEIQDVLNSLPKFQEGGFNPGFGLTHPGEIIMSAPDVKMHGKENVLKAIELARTFVNPTAAHKTVEDRMVTRFIERQEIQNLINNTYNFNISVNPVVNMNMDSAGLATLPADTGLKIGIVTIDTINRGIQEGKVDLRKGLN